MGQQDLSVQELVDKIKRDEIRLPEMQRRYVWKKTQVRDLLDSLYRGYPSGMILTWENSEDVPTRDFAVEQKVSGQQRFELLLDGQQRLTSLVAILSGDPVTVRDRQNPIDILFNLEHPEELKEPTEIDENEQDGDGNDSDSDISIDGPSDNELEKRFAHLAFVVNFNKLAMLPNWVSVTAVFKESSERPFLDKAGVTSFEDPRYDRFTKRLKRLRDIKDYKYRVQMLERNMSYEKVTDIYVRVNSLGNKLRSSDLALAQITAIWRDSLHIFQKFEKHCRNEKSFDLDLSTHLKNLIVFATDQSKFKNVGKLKQKDLEKAWEEAQEGMLFALDFLRSNINIDSRALLSSPFIILVLAAYCHKKSYNLSPEESKRLRYWVLVASTKGRYSHGSSETFLDQDLNTIKRGGDVGGLLQSLKTQTGRLEIIPGDLENRSNLGGYFKIMYLAFRQDEARDWHNQLVITRNRIDSKNAIQFHHIFPHSLLKKHSIPNANDICNLAFISGRTNRRISDKEPAKYLPDVINRIGQDGLTKQCIPCDRSLWTLDAYDKFLVKRRELIADRLNQFLGHEDN